MNVSAFVWTSLGLNQGSPDYETRKVISHESTLLVIILIIDALPNHRLL